MVMDHYNNNYKPNYTWPLEWMKSVLPKWNTSQHNEKQNV